MKNDALFVASHIAFAMLLLGAWLFHLSVPFLAILFAYLVLSNLKVRGQKWIAGVVFTLLVFTIFYVFTLIAKQAAHSLPEAAERSVKAISKYAQEWDIDLPIDDGDSLKAVTIATVRQQASEVAHFAFIATKDFIVILISLVVAMSIFMNPAVDLSAGRYAIKNNLYTTFVAHLSARIINFYESFKTVMGAQLVISLINTSFTGVFLLAVGIPYAQIIIVVTFLCGLLPIVGNLISNTIIFCVAITVSLQDAVFALCFLIVLHKFEYFLNSKIIGHRISNPMWLTLIGLIVGEQLMGIPGMILAPVVLNYVKQEGVRIEVI